MDALDLDTSRHKSQFRVRKGIVAFREIDSGRRVGRSLGLRGNIPFLFSFLAPKWQHFCIKVSRFP